MVAFGCRIFSGVAINPDKDVISCSLYTRQTFEILVNSSFEFFRCKNISKWSVLFHFNLPTRVLKVVSSEHSSSRGACQKADLMSAKVNAIALLISVRRWSTVCRGYSERLSDVLGGLLSMQSLFSRTLVYNGRSNYPFCSSVTFSIMPCFCRSFTSAINLSFTERGISLGAVLCRVTSCIPIIPTFQYTWTVTQDGFHGERSWHFWSRCGIVSTHIADAPLRKCEFLVKWRTCSFRIRNHINETASSASPEISHGVAWNPNKNSPVRSTVKQQKWCKNIAVASPS